MLDVDAVRALEKLGNIRRQLNLVAVKLLKSHSLHPKQMIMLRFVYHEGEVSLTQLARGTFTDMAAASRAIGPLIKQGWLKKVRNPTDSRCWIIQLTPRARKKLPALEKLYSKLADMMVETLSRGERKELVSLLDRISEQLDERR